MILKQNKYHQFYIDIGCGYWVINAVLQSDSGLCFFKLNSLQGNFIPSKSLLLKALQADKILTGMGVKNVQRVPN